MSFFKKNEVKRPNCPKCGLDKGCLSPRMRYTGEGKKGILIIAEAPGEEEDKCGTQLVGVAGSRLRNELRALGMDLDKDCYKTNSVNCRPVDSEGSNTKPSAQNISCCKPYVQGIIKDTKPSKIFLMGNVALESFYGGRTREMSSIGKIHGLKLWDSIHNAWVFPLWHPSYIERSKKDELLVAEWERCLKRAVEADGAPLEKEWNSIIKLLHFDTAIDALKNCLLNDTVIAIDFETTGLDIYKKGHSTASFAWANEHNSWSVPVEHPYWNTTQQQQIKKLIGKILRKPKLRKIVHSIAFEYQWTKHQFGVEPNNFFWDTQLATHVLDNRQGIARLKFQAFMRWGIGEYDKEADQYIKTDPKTGFNNMLKMPVDALLEYNACDTLYTYELYKEQQGEFEGKEFEAYNFLHEGATVLCEMSYNGIQVSEDYYLRQKEVLEAERVELCKEIMDSDEVRMYRKRFGEFNFDSPQHLQKMLFRVLNLKPTKETGSSTDDKKVYSVDEEVLTRLNIPLTKKILKVRKLNKMITTYVDGFLNKAIGGALHPYFSLSRARSFRSSSQNPNFQNIPKRDPRAKKITRSGMIPRAWRVLGEMDFEGAEIVTSIFYHKDPTFIKYQVEGRGDMHQDAAAHILKVSSEDIPKEVRQATKGIWTFAQFYGSYYANCAKQGWEEYPQCTYSKGPEEGKLCLIRGVPIDEHMRNTFPNYQAFEQHLKKFENTFWKSWFPQYTRWKEKVVSDYKRTGYVETFLGFRYKGYMNGKQCTNYPIQGTSFHLLLAVAVQFYREVRKRGLKTLLVGQIHDSLVLDIPTDEVDVVAQLLANIVRTLHEKFDWMTVPMDLELEISEPYEQGGSFAAMSTVDLEKAA